MALGNIYKAYTDTLNKKLAYEIIIEKDIDYPTVEMGLQGVQYLEKCIESSTNNSAWVEV